MNPATKAHASQDIIRALYKDAEAYLYKEVEQLVRKNKSYYPATESECFKYNGTLYPNLVLAAFYKTPELHTSLVPAFLAIQEEQEKLVEEKNRLKAYLRSVLNKCHSLGDMVAVLPTELHKLWAFRWDNLDLSEVTLCEEEIVGIKRITDQYLPLIRERLVLNILLK